MNPIVISIRLLIMADLIVRWSICMRIILNRKKMGVISTAIT